MELLQAAARVAAPTGAEAYPDDQLGFALLYDTPPDIDAERARLAELLGSEGFDLFSYGPGDPRQLILNFPGVPIETSPDYMLKEGEELRRALGLVAVLPEVPPLYAPTDLAMRAEATESLGAILDVFCLSSAAEPADPMWAARMVKADAAWANYNVSGQQVPRTGPGNLQLRSGNPRR